MWKQQSTIVSIAAFLSLSVVAQANATTVFVDDFEDSLTTGWLVTGAGQGGGNTGVATHNGGLMAFASHASAGPVSGIGWTGLSQDFSYAPNSSLAFDMQATATAVSGAVGGTMHAESGVTISLLNNFNVSLGSISLVYATSGTVGSNQTLIDSSQHNYDLAMSDYASAAGLSPVDPIAKISLNFWSQSRYYFGGNIYPNYRSNATVWFDNVTIDDGSGVIDDPDDPGTGIVPLPPAILLLGAAFGVLALKKRR